ncbi:MAG: DNA-directed RNA polymerase [Candidatus Pacearchaeota archaeon]
MFYIVELEDYIRVEPSLFGLSTKDAIKEQLKKSYKEYFNKEIGVIIGVIEILNVEDGIIIFGDGAVYYNTAFKILTWKPEIQELVFGIIENIENFGATINLGLVNGIIHVSQTMEDYVTISKSNSLLGKNTKKTLKKGDLVIARIVALSQKYDEIKIGLTMRQPGLGKLEWIEEEKRKVKKSKEKEETKSHSKKEKKK